MSRTVLFVAGVLFVICLPAAQSVAQDPPPATPYYPMKVGTTWQYRVGADKMTVKVTKHEKIGDLTCARVEAVFKGSTTVEYVAVKADGVYRVKADDKEIKPALCFLRLPPGKEKSWKVNAEIDGTKIRGTFEAKDDPVTVPAGTFSAIMVSSKDYTIGSRPMKLTYWFVEGKGIVKHQLEIDGFDLILELEQFTPGQ